MTTPDLAGLCERLRAAEVSPFAPGLRHESLINPGGLEAAAVIERLVAALERVRDADPYHVSSQIARTALEGASDDR